MKFLKKLFKETTKKNFNIKIKNLGEGVNTPKYLSSTSSVVWVGATIIGGGGGGNKSIFGIIRPFFSF